MSNPEGFSDNGKKFDAGKQRWDLLPWKEVGDIVEILAFGAKKYSDDNWKKVPEAVKRYKAAIMRHLVAYFNDEGADKETGKSHLAHAGCCLLFLMWFEKNKTKEE